MDSSPEIESRCRDKGKEIQEGNKIKGEKTAGKGSNFGIGLPMASKGLGAGVKPSSLPAGSFCDREKDAAPSVERSVLKQNKTKQTRHPSMLQRNG